MYRLECLGSGSDQPAPHLLKVPPQSPSALVTGPEAREVCAAHRHPVEAMTGENQPMCEQRRPFTEKRPRSEQVLPSEGQTEPIHLRPKDAKVMK